MCCAGLFWLLRCYSTLPLFCCYWRRPSGEMKSRGAASALSRDSPASPSPAPRLEELSTAPHRGIVKPGWLTRERVIGDEEPLANV
jgi:hypothetical protein